MKKVILNGDKMVEKDEIHTYLKTELEITGYYGNNVDALWDALSTNNQLMQIHLIHSEKMLESLDQYGKAVVKVFEDAARENSNIEFYLS